jgi:mono/diheme cytochrome c family protein
VSGVGLVLGIACVVWAAESKLPPEYANKKNTVKATPQSIAAGKKLYEAKCLSCHGKTGKGDGDIAKKLQNVKMPDLSTAEFAKDSDQEIFWIISEGSKDQPLMAAFKKDKELSNENNRWNLVNYLRTLAPKKR